MRIGIPEVVIILIVLIAIAISARMFRTSSGSTKKGNHGSADVPVRRVNGRAPRTWSYFRRIGTAFILVGAVLLFAGIGMLRWAFQSYMWAFIMVAIGFVMVLLSRKK